MARRMPNARTGGNPDRNSAAMMRLSPKLLAAALAAAGCGVPLVTVEPEAPLRHEGPVAVTVTGVAAPEALFRTGAESAEVPGITLVELEVENRARERRSIDLTALRLRATDVWGRATTAAPFVASSGTLPRHQFTGGPAVRTLGLEPGERYKLWLAFGGAAGRRARIQRLALVAPDLEAAPVTLGLVEPREGATRLVYRQLPLAMNLRAGFAGVGEFGYRPVFELETLEASGRFVFGLSLLNGALSPASRGTTERRIGSVFGIGPRLGWITRAGIGVVASAEAGFGYRVELGTSAGEGNDDSRFWHVRTAAALRISVGETVGVVGAILPAEHRSPSILRGFNIDLGYAYWFTKDDSLGGGAMLMIGAPLVAR
jgi:hypothetical protein